MKRPRGNKPPHLMARAPCAKQQSLAVRCGGKTVLVGVLKRKRDLSILLNEHWYRIPLVKAPKRKFGYLAFYEPARFGREGKKIRYYTSVVRCSVHKRKNLLPDEKAHPKANEQYLKIQVGRIEGLPHPIINAPPRRVSFGFATLKRLFASRTILQLYHVTPTEEIIEKELKRVSLHAISQKHISVLGRHYCLDFAIPCRCGSIAVECDNKKAHSGTAAQRRDRGKDKFLRSYGWTVIRLKEEAIVSDARSCISKVRRAIKNLGGVA